MDGEEEVLVGRGANYVCRCEEFPVQHGCILEKASAEDLQGDDTKDDILRERFVTTELGNLRRAEALLAIYPCITIHRRICRSTIPLDAP